MAGWWPIRRQVRKAGGRGWQGAVAARLGGLLLVVLVAGCSSHALTYYVREGADLTFIKKVAVMPLANNTKEKFAADRVRNIVLTQVLVDSLFDVTETGQLEKILEEEAGKADAPLDEALARRLGKRLSVQAFLLGSVDAYDEERKGNYSYPVVAMTLKLVDAETGLILWQASGSYSGYSSWSRILGTQGRDQSAVTFRLVRSLLASLSGD
ncbi:MAG: CsgG/HfaB family protein [Thermodesulfobacteriota bacterium]